MMMTMMMMMFLLLKLALSAGRELCVVVHDVSETGAHCRPDTLTMLTRSTPFIKIKAGHQSRSFLSVPECN